MRIEGLLFALLAVFFVATGCLYWILSRDPAGFTLVLLTGGLSFMVGYYLLFTARRMDARPEDRMDAEISEGAGEMGFFAPHSWWPIAMAASFTLTILGVAFGSFMFMLVIGAACLVVTASGFLFEYYVGVNRTQSHTLSTLEAMGEQSTSSRKFLGE